MREYSKIKSEAKSAMLNKSESYGNDMLHIISEQYVCVLVWARATESVRQTWQTECTTCQWTHPLHSATSCCSPASRDRQSVITASTWAASRLYTSAPGALHLGQEALCCLFPAPDLHEAGRLSLIAQKGHEAWNSVKLFYINHWDRVTVWQEYRFIPQSRHSAKKSTPPK